MTEKKFRVLLQIQVTVETNDGLDEARRIAFVNFWNASRTLDIARITNIQVLSSLGLGPDEPS